MTVNILDFLFVVMRYRYFNFSTWNRSRAVLYVAIGSLLAVVFGLIVLVGVFAYVARDLPSPDRVVRREGFATKIFDRNGKLLYDVFDSQRRTPVDIQTVPMVVRQATISIEDKNFYRHSGFDPLGIFRAALRSIWYRRLEGGSTVTQQLVKNTLLDSRQTMSRKIKEFILTLQIEQKYTKDQILQMYLNEAPYGGTAYGIESAAQTYFGKSVSQLNLPEAAVLAGLPQSPTYYSPFGSKAYMARSYEVLRRMREDGYITAKQETDSRNQIDAMKFSAQTGVLKAPHFVFYVKQKLIERYGEKAVEQGGLRVTTTLDAGLQELAQKTVLDEINNVKHLKISNGAAIAIDPQTGQILTMVGSKDWSDPNYDGKYNVALALRQPGSTIKPVVYLAGLRRGYTASTMLMDTKTSFPGGDKPEYVPENYDGKFRGPILVREALGNSINVPAVKMLSLVGIKDMMGLAFEMGLSTMEPTAENLKRVGLSVALGGGEIRPLDIVSAYSAFANGGIRRDPISILKVTDSNGQTLEEWKPSEGRRVISAEEAFIISSILSDPKARDITFGPRSLINIDGKTISVKTGTTNDKRDNWTIGWTPSVIVGVWVGNNDNSPMKDVASGVTGAAPIWRKIILEALKEKFDQPLSPPSGIVAMDVDKISGFAVHDGFDAKPEFFIKGTEPAGDDPIHKKIRDCNGNLREVLILKESDPFEKDGKNLWQTGIDTWLKDQADQKFHPENINSCGNQIWITVLNPADKSKIETNDVDVKLEVTSPIPIKKIEISLDGQLQKTLLAEPWKATINATNSSYHKIDIAATDEQNNVGSRFVEIGVNQDFSH